MSSAAGPIRATSRRFSAARSAPCSSWRCSAPAWSGRPTSAGRCGTTPRPTSSPSITSGASRGDGRRAAIAGVGHPVGTSIGNTDAIPSLAFPLKLLHLALPDPLQYLGAWVLLCYVLQGVFGALLVRQVTADLTLQVLGAALFVQTPALLHRFGHTALCAHWTLLAAIWIAADRLPRLPLAPRRLAAAVRGGRRDPAVPGGDGRGRGTGRCGQRRPGRGADRASCPHRRGRRRRPRRAVTLAVFWLSGYFLLGAATDFGLAGVGDFSMNLLSPVIGTAIPACCRRFPPPAPGQYEGLVYFGAGWLALALARA